jgi:hypothetical protein
MARSSWTSSGGAGSDNERVVDNDREGTNADKRRVKNARHDVQVAENTGKDEFQR